MNAPRSIVGLAAGIALAISSLAAAQPAPVHAHVPSVSIGASTRLELRQDTCYTWGTPELAIDGTQIAVTQSVTPVAGCMNGQAPTALIAIGALPLGSYRLTYTPVPMGFGPLPVSTVEFDVRPFSTGRRFVIDPPFPLAFEPLTMSFLVFDECESVVGFRPIAGGFRVDLAGTLESFVCDTVGNQSVSIGAYPPGTYRIELGRTESLGGETYGTLDLVVRPGATGTSRFDGGGEDYSGLWFSRNEEPSTGMTFVHSSPVGGTAGASSTLIGIWYRYGADGVARWYWVEATTAQRSLFNGTVYAYSENDPALRPELRTVGAIPVGTVQIFFPGGTAGFPASVRGTVDGEAVDFRLQRFRWSRAAWPQVPQ